MWEEKKMCVMIFNNFLYDISLRNSIDIGIVVLVKINGVICDSSVVGLRLEI